MKRPFKRWKPGQPVTKKVKIRWAASRRNGPPDKAWHEKHQHLTKHVPSRRSNKVHEKTLVVIGEHISGTAKWRKIYGVWSCAEADLPLKWMIGQPRNQVHLELLRLGVDFQWKQTVPVNPLSVQSLPTSELNSPPNGTSSTSGPSLPLNGLAGVAPTRPTGGLFRAQTMNWLKNLIGTPKVSEPAPESGPDVRI